MTLIFKGDVLQFVCGWTPPTMNDEWTKICGTTNRGACPSSFPTNSGWFTPRWIHYPRGDSCVQGEGVFLGNPKDSVWEDWGNFREHQGRLGESPPPLKNLIKQQLPQVSGKQKLRQYDMDSVFLLQCTLVGTCYMNIVTLNNIHKISS